ncbi:UvrD-helicase domain-containing protein [Altibacter sp. HG106]|uniref:UvrD-helicase domain-containing protein n=1 Tax=Altibacter sp. HG106 TaxID=3023937 RepID=UPI002350F25F|nr:UvrD-helicase domain-containing protein [Altibacter sp. HG106]MDC7994916.1 UvrD-helicase domain-containing protein [Altibacter sp. HG106]
MNKPPFTIYDAAAGSGKTYTLVKAYLINVLATSEKDYYRYSLAITFTNKAVAEMKSRIVWTLVGFSEPKSLSTPSSLFVSVAQELDITFEELQQRSRAILRHLLHHYALFSVETIDHFNHRLLRTFARDLNLPANFEVSMEVDELLAEAVDRLINKAGTDPALTSLLIAFALEKTDDDKSWDIARDIGTVAALLFSENDAAYVKRLQHKSLEDFTALRKTVQQEKKDREQAVVQLASEAIHLIHEQGLDSSHFSGGYFYKFLTKVSEGIFQHNFETAWQRNLEEKPLYPQKISEAEKARVDSIAAQLIESFLAIRESLFRLLLLENILNNLTPLALLHEVQKELNALKEENGLILISEFNALIHDSIKEQPAPFIYERLGEKYRHFFIDEFQDTSLLQWENLKPLIANALTQQYPHGLPGSLMIVGDAKQSIYRWRGGLPEQFISLYSDENPFPVAKHIENLDTNFRSFSEIIDFNNRFFQYVARFFQRDTHQELFLSGNQQKVNPKQGGGIKLHAVTAENKEELHEAYGTCVLRSIQELADDGFALGDLCILSRTRNDGVRLSRFLMEQGIAVISSESLLLVQSPVVQFLVHTLRMISDAQDLVAKAAWLSFLHGHLGLTEKEHDFVEHYLNATSEELETMLRDKELIFDVAVATQLSLFEMFAYCLQSFALESEADTYVFHFMDLVFEFEQQPLVSKHNFLPYWEQQQEKASVSAPGGRDAVRVMTIHQSKGLEFPVVLFPYADMKLYDHRNAKVWYPWTTTSETQHLLINYKKELAYYGDIGASMVAEQQSILELDQINLLYVTLTRAVERLYVYFNKPSKLKDAPSSFNEFLAGFLETDGRWDDTTDTFAYGSFASKQSQHLDATVASIVPTFRSVLPETHQLHAVSRDALLWDTTPGEAIAWGDQLHGVMELILHEEDAEWALEELVSRKTLPEKDVISLRQVVAQLIGHPQLKPFFNANASQVAVEKDIITKTGHVLRPDRIHFHDNGSVTVMDYKTGIPRSTHVDQIEQYASALEEMGYAISEKLIIYCSEQGIEINKSYL